LNREAIQKFLKRIPLLDLDEENLDVIPMIHNPEEHWSRYVESAD
jgi:hypothetical protein